jgi:GNAT superfamily N-acetyltransferase
MTPPFALRRLAGEPAEMAALQRVLEAAPRYFERVTGAPPGPAEAQSMFSALPPDKTYEDKRVWGLYAGDEMIGCADVIRGYPARDKAVIGLLLVAEPWQRRGIGTAFERLVTGALAEWPEIATSRIAVIASNRGALAFWRAIGYRETGETRPAAPPFVADAIVLERALEELGSGTPSGSDPKTPDARPGNRV